MCSMKQNDEFLEHAQENNLDIEDVMSAEESEFLAENVEETGEMTDTQLAMEKGVNPNNY